MRLTESHCLGRSRTRIQPNHVCSAWAADEKVYTLREELNVALVANENKEDNKHGEHEACEVVITHVVIFEIAASRSLRVAKGVLYSRLPDGNMTKEPALYDSEHLNHQFECVRYPSGPVLLRRC